MSEPKWHAAPLVWGNGPRLFEVFLEPTCPFSARAFGKFDALLASLGEERITIRVWLLSQPWHLFSPIVVRSILAASTLENGREAAHKVMRAVFARRDEFEFEHHCSGPNLDCTPHQLIARIEEYAGLSLAQAFAIPDLDREIKRHAKYARQNGAHVSPTFMIDGLIDPAISSGDAVSDWASRL